MRTPIVESRYIPNDVKHDVWRRDAGQCAYVTSIGRRCNERTFLELHHIRPYVKQGPGSARFQPGARRSIGRRQIRAIRRKTRPPRL